MVVLKVVLKAGMWAELLVDSRVDEMAVLLDERMVGYWVLKKVALLVAALVDVLVAMMVDCWVVTTVVWTVEL